VGDLLMQSSEYQSFCAGMANGYHSSQGDEQSSGSYTFARMAIDG
jgi:hypothetical protein